MRAFRWGVIWDIVLSDDLAFLRAFCLGFIGHIVLSDDLALLRAFCWGFTGDNVMFDDVVLLPLFIGDIVLRLVAGDILLLNGACELLEPEIIVLEFVTGATVCCFGTSFSRAAHVGGGLGFGDEMTTGTGNARFRLITAGKEFTSTFPKTG